MFGLNSSVEQVLHITPAISNEMSDAIEKWTLMYENRAPWLHEPSVQDPTCVRSLGLPAFIASEKARMAVIEFKSEITAPQEVTEVENPKYSKSKTDEFGNVIPSREPKTIIQEKPVGTTERATFMNKQYQEKLLPKIRTQLEYGIAKGSLIIKPYVTKHQGSSVAGTDEATTEDEKDVYSMDFDFIQADCFYPLSFDGNGNLIEVAFVQPKIDGDKIYLRLEHHKLVGNTLYVTNRAFENDYNKSVLDIHVLGREINLSQVSEWRNIQRQATIKNVDRLLFGYFKMPEANTIDPHSPLGLSGFARAVDLIEDADKQYSRLLWEFEGGQLAVDVDRDAVLSGEYGSSLGQLQQRLYRKLDLGESDTYKPYAPTLRDGSLLNGLNSILMRIEDVCALSRGTISDVTSEARTATELKILRQRTFSSNLDIQKALEQALKDTVYAMNVYCTIYNIVGDIKKVNDKIDVSKIGKYDVSFEWDDSILVDVDSELGKRMTLLNAGLISKEEVRKWYMGETDRQAREALQKIADESQQATEQNMANQMEMSQLANSQREESQMPQRNQSPQKFGQLQKQQQKNQQQQPRQQKKQQSDESDEEEQG